MGEKIFYRDLFFEKTVFFKMILEPSGVEEITTGLDLGIGFREISENFTNFYTYTTENILPFLEEKVVLFFKGEPFEELKYGIEKSLLERSNLPKGDRYFSFLKAMEKEIPEVPEIKHYRLGLTEVQREIVFFNSQGEFCETKRKYLRLVALVVAEKDGNLERGYEAKGYSLSLERALEIDPGLYFLGKKASNLAQLMLSARKAKAGVMPVILAGEAGGTMIHEAVGHGLEADHAEEGLSVYTGRLEEKVASPLITVIDDPTIPNLYGSYEIDDEGVPAEKVVLIEKGVLKNYLYDRYSALKWGKTPNGHGRRENFRHLPIPRMANTFIAPSEHTPEEIIKSVPKGILVKKMGGGEVNPLTGDFVFEVVEGYYIEKGEIAYPVKGATLVGNGPKVLESIDMVGKDLHFEAGTCGKDGQGVAVSDGQPTLRIPELTVGGVVE